MGSSIEEYDDFRPCFFESGEDEFYDAPAPSEDIWKKFELLPTPPRSPKHETLYSSVLMPTTLEKLRVVSEMLDDPITKTALSLTDICPPKCMDVCCNFNSKLIHDCMWSGHIVPQEFKIGQSPSTDCNTSSSSRPRTCSFSLTLDSTSCVDPNVAAVFPYPVNDQTRQIQREGSVGAETPSDSDSSDSSDDEEDEEIDVVTVADKVQMAARPRLPAASRPVLPATPTTSAASAQVAAMAMHNYTAAAPRSPKAEPSSSSSSSSHRHSSSSTPRSSSSNSSSTSRSLVQKRQRHHHHHHHPTKKAKFTLSSKFSVSSSSELRTVIHKYQRLSNNARISAASNRCSSDSEDSDGRRAQHNVLERKRRNDLKSSFHRLRDAVPDLQAQERAAKVTILKKAADHILSLRRTHQTLVTEHDRQKRTHEALQRRLRQLRSK